MASWNTEATVSSFDAVEKTTDYIGGRAGNRTGNQSSKIFGINTDYFSKYDIVGINATKVKDMKNAITLYVEALQTHLDGLDEKVSTAVGFKSKEVSAAVTDYLVTLKTYCKNLISQLLAFNDKLQDVADQWYIATQNISSQVKSSGDGFSKGGAYSETKTTGVGTEGSAMEKQFYGTMASTDPRFRVN